MKEKVYVETSVVSYYTSRPSNHIMTLAKQRITEQWWPVALERFDIFVSETVLEEAGDGDPGAAAKRLAAIEDFPLLDIDEEVQKVYQTYLEYLPIPPNALRDATHLAVASVHGMDYVVTWNCTHIANGEIIKKLIRINSERGISIPVIVTPEELME